MQNQLQKINKSLEDTIPYYKTINGCALTIFVSSLEQAQNAYQYAEQTLSSTGDVIVKKGTNIKKVMEETIEAKTDIILSKVEALVKIEKGEQSGIEVKSPIKRVQIILIRINQLIRLTGQNTTKYTLDLIQKGKKNIYSFSLPLYINIKATVLVTKDMMLQVLQGRLNNMKVTYQASKDTVTMLISGKFHQEQIKQKISQGLRNFKKFTVEVAHKGLQIKVDRQSLLQNYDAFSLKFLEVIRTMRQLGTQNLTSLKTKSTKLYQDVINRIKAKEIQIKANYRQEYLKIKSQ